MYLLFLTGNRMWSVMSMVPQKDFPTCAAHFIVACVADVYSTHVIISMHVFCEVVCVLAFAAHMLWLACVVVVACVVTLLGHHTFLLYR